MCVPPGHRGLGRVPTPVPTGPSRLFFLPSFHPLRAPSSLWGIDAGVSAPTEQAPHLSPQLLLCISPPVGGRLGAGGGRHSRAHQPGLGGSGAGLSDQPRICVGKAPNTQLTCGVGTRCVTSPLSPLTPVYPGTARAHTLNPRLPRGRGRAGWRVGSGDSAVLREGPFPPADGARQPGQREGRGETQA